MARPVQKLVLFCILAAAIVTSIVLSTAPPPRPPYRELGVMQVLQSPDALWVFVEEHEVKPIPPGTSGHRHILLAAVHVYELGENGITGEYHLAPTPLPSIHRNITCLFAWQGTLFAYCGPSRYEVARLFVWNGAEFVEAPTEHLQQLNEVHDLPSMSWGDVGDKLDTLTEASDWSVVYRDYDPNRSWPLLVDLGTSQIGIRFDVASGRRVVIIEHANDPNWSVMVAPGNAD